MTRRPPRSTQSRSSAASDVYKRQVFIYPTIIDILIIKQSDWSVTMYKNLWSEIPVTRNDSSIIRKHNHFIYRISRIAKSILEDSSPPIENTNVATPVTRNQLGRIFGGRNAD
eukprot:TRINITY_DN33808_c0_g1_i1.p1 TRINITY_DN33808_c0_g1~~TRINITY_DN33808_c0_g1_i1.p1  ORF type:complete len:113 (+),score=12.56 TRINITY_DN33808_c0_g1_i1:12-350(+)